MSDEASSPLASDNEGVTPGGANENPAKSGLTGPVVPGVDVPTEVADVDPSLIVVDTQTPADDQTEISELRESDGQPVGEGTELQPGETGELEGDGSGHALPDAEDA